MDYFLLIRLIGAHLVADFLLQSDRTVAQRWLRKWSSSWLYIHAAIAGGLGYFFAAQWTAVWLPFVIAFTHSLVDGVKVQVKDNACTFALDQAVHLAVIIGCWVFLIDDPVAAWHLVVRKVEDPWWWVILLSYLAVIWPAGIAIGKVTASRFHKTGTDQADPSDRGDKTGQWIGWLERFLILTFVLLDRFEAIGFLIAAKSVFRFGELRKEAEYIIVGTLLSFSLAIIVGLFARHLLAVL